MNKRRPFPTRSLETPLGWLVAILAVVWACWPFHEVVSHYPWKIDAVKWVTRGATDRPGWTEWVFSTQHFVGYRPVAALSYSANYHLVGWSPEMYRITDIVLHGLASLAVAGLFRSLTGARARWLVVPALLFAAHPVSEEIVPFLARRSYALGALLTALGLKLWIDSLSRENSASPGALVGAILLVFALLTNEVAYVVVPLLPLLALHRRASGWRDALARVFPTWVGAVAAVGIRFAVIETSGGYDTRYLAFARNGRKLLRRTSDWNGDAIFGAAFDYTWLPVTMNGDTHPLRADWTLADLGMESSLDITMGVRGLLFVTVVFYLWQTLFRPLFSEVRHHRITWILTLWMVGCAMLFALSETWFWRQGYSMAVPAVLLMSWHLWDTVQHADTRRRWTLVPQLLLMGTMVFQGALFDGWSHYKMEPRIAANGLIHAVMDAEPEFEDRSTVFLIAPGNKKTEATTKRWLGRLLEGRSIRLVVLATGMPARGNGHFEGDELVFGRKITPKKRETATYNIKDGRVRLHSLRSPHRDNWLVYANGRGEWKVKRLKRR